MIENKSWTEIYRPKTLDQCILPASTKADLQKYIDTKSIPNLLLSGPPGIGKTTAARVLVDSIGADMMYLNGSLEGNVDTLRTKIQQFASTMSMNGEKKYVLLDEADGMSQQAQNGLRAFMEEYAANCGFILVCNFKEKLIDAIAESRLTEISFAYSREERPQLARGLYGLIVEIFNKHSIQFDSKVVQTVLVEHLQHSQDIRKLLNKIQRASIHGTFDPSTIDSGLAERFDSLVSFLKAKDFKSVRVWLGENSDLPAEKIYRYIYENSNQLVKSQAVPPMILILAKYQYQQSLVVDGELNLAACMIELISECF